jgi:hypothetical protein
VDDSSEEASSVSASSEEEEEEYIDGEDRKRPCRVKGTVNRRSSGRNDRPCEEVIGAKLSASADVLVHPSPRTARKPRYKFSEHIRTPKCIDSHCMVKMTLQNDWFPRIVLTRWHRSMLGQLLPLGICASHRTDMLLGVGPIWWK